MELKDLFLCAYRLAFFVSLLVRRHVGRAHGAVGWPDNPPPSDITIIVTEDKKPISPNLYGIFFEEIQHAGEGGLYAELVQDRSFDGLAYSGGFLTAPHATNTVVGSRARKRVSDEEGVKHSYKAQPQSWVRLGDSVLTLTREYPVNENNPIAMSVSSPSGTPGIANTGYWGIPVQEGKSYHLSAFLRVLCGDSQTDKLSDVLATLESSNGTLVYASFIFQVVCWHAWEKYHTLLTANGTDPSARLAFRLQRGTPSRPPRGAGSPGTLHGPLGTRMAGFHPLVNGTATVDGLGGARQLLQSDDASLEMGGGRDRWELLLDVVSLFPQENGREGSVSPFRKDLLDLLKGLNPRFLRFPGGCYVEGVVLANGFYWKPTVGPIEERPGHWNGPWEYWSTDGLGMYEYLLLTEELGAEPVWVINSGVSHLESLPTWQIESWVQDVLDGIEFIMGDSDSPYGSLRAAMGHPNPWQINFIGIGNEDCGKPYYLTNYKMFYSAIRAAYPHIRLIANCELGEDAPSDLWDWHWYTDPLSMFRGRHTFDNMSVAANGNIFASEYAVFDWGIPTAPAGNIQGAVAEAAFMMGMERNGDKVSMASYAPLLAHVRHQGMLCPTNLILFDNYRSFGNPSYHLQAMFAKFRGSHYLETKVISKLPDDGGVTASTTCPDETCSLINFKVACYSPTICHPYMRLRLRNIRLKTQTTVLRSDSPTDSNSFDEPLKVSPYVKKGELPFTLQIFLKMRPWSIWVFDLVRTVGNETGHVSNANLTMSQASGDISEDFVVDDEDREFDDLLVGEEDDEGHVSWY
eukprot:jgi/Botrbrau1/14412/Bobra.0014s0059.1